MRKVGLDLSDLTRPASAPTRMLKSMFAHVIYCESRQKDRGLESGIWCSDVFKSLNLELTVVEYEQQRAPLFRAPTEVFCHTNEEKRDRWTILPYLAYQHPINF